MPEKDRKGEKEMVRKKAILSARKGKAAAAPL